MNEIDLEDSGFAYIKTYYHGDNNEFKTNRYTKGELEVEINYINDSFESADVTSEINCLQISFSDLLILDRIINV